MKNAALIYNPLAGRNRDDRDRQIEKAVSILHQNGIGARLFPTKGPDYARDKARRLCEAGEEFIIACGGDGTINEVINGIAPGRTTLAILPAGTANVFARELRIPPNPLRAAREMVKCTARRIALGRARWNPPGKAAPEQRYFLCLAGVGFDAYVVRSLTWQFKLKWGVFAYVWEALRQAMRYHYPIFLCRSDGQDFPATFATIQRTRRYAGWLRLAPNADLFQPRFSACVFSSPGFIRYLRYSLAVVTGLHPRLADVCFLPSERIECRSKSEEHPVYFELDGELAGTLPATFDIVPDALTMLVPNSAS